ncbi:MAG: hypothetical protein IBX69_06990 [Anaerolineales bacterium]|nr:hypothetical protein [Anaerolineales bacterium]
MDLINLYVKEVGSHLPEKMRADIEREIRSLIEDMLVDESEKQGRQPDQEMIVSILEKMGPPDKVAASYQPPRYLIGPQLFPHYTNTLRIVFSVVTILAALAIGVSAGARVDPPPNILEVIGIIISGVLDALIRAFAIVTLIFAAIQFFEPEFKSKARKWDPRKLRAMPDQERLGIPGALVEIVVSVLALVVFNFYGHWIGLSTIQDGEWVHFPVLTEVFFRYLPWLSLIWIIQAVFNVLLIARGHWTAALRWTAAVISSLTILILAWMLSGPPIAALSVEATEVMSWDLTLETIQQINQGLNVSARLVIGIVIALETVDLGKQLFKLLRHRLPEPQLGE